MPDRPLIPISVLLPVRDRSISVFTLKFLQGQLLAQDELVISFNKTSPPLVEAVMSQAMQLGVRVKVLEWATIKPLYPHWREIIAAASHDLILFVHDDDVYHGRIVDLVRGTFSSDADAAFVTSQMVNILLSKKLEIRSDGDKKTVLKYDWLSYFHEKKTTGFIAQFNTSFYGMRRSRMSQLDLLLKNPVFGDFLLFHSGLLGGNLHVLPEFLAARLQHGSNEVYNELYKTAHFNRSLEVLFSQKGLSDTLEGKIYLDSKRASLLKNYLYAWKIGIASGIDPKKLLVVYRRLRRLSPGACGYKRMLLHFLMGIRGLNLWKVQRKIYNFGIQSYRRLRGPSRFYRQFPELTVEELALVMEQPKELIEHYLRIAYAELGTKK